MPVSGLMRSNLLHVHTAYVTLFCAHSISLHVEQNVLNLELVLFHLKHYVSIKQSTIRDFLCFSEDYPAGKKHAESVKEEHTISC
jgi:hypothetical protein